LSADNVGRQKSVVCHEKIGRFLSPDKNRPTRKVFKTELHKIIYDK